MSGRQAEIFAGILGTDEAEFSENSLNSLRTGFQHNFMQDHLARSFKNCSPKKPQTPDAMWDFMNTALNMIGIEIKYAELDDKKTGKYFNGSVSVSTFEDELETDFAILDALRLIQFVDTGHFILGNRWKIKVMFYFVTQLGLDFAKACGVTA